jgi:hypothetical protein
LKGLKILLTILFVVFLTHKSQGQVVTQTYLDPCDLKTYVVTIPIQTNTGVLVIIRGSSKVFTYSQFTNGEVTTWINSIFATPCPSTTIVTQTVTQTVTQAVTQSASSAASSSASSAASSAASSSTTPTSSSSQSSSQSSSSGESGSSETSSVGSEENSSGGESKSESKDEKKSDEKKKEEKKKVAPANPMLVASDLTSAQGPDFKYNAIASFGISQSSLAGNETWSTNDMIWSTLNQFALSGGYTKMDFQKGKLNTIHSYSVTTAYLEGNYMGLIGYTNVKPNPKFGTYGYNVGLITLLLKNNEVINFKTGETKEVFNTSLSTSLVVFWTKPYSVQPKITLSPQIFLMNSPIAWNSKTGETTVNRQLSFLLGSSFDYKISKRFGLSLNYRLSGDSQVGSPLLNNFLVGSRLIL